MTIRKDEWFSALFGYPVFSMNARSVRNSESRTEMIAEHARLQDRAFYFTKVPVADVETVRGLAGAGFYAVDVHVNLCCEIGQASTSQPALHEIREPSGSEWDAVLDIAGSTFRFSRFHLDPLIPDTLANLIKRSWMESYRSGARGEKVLIALAHGEPAGFLAVHKSQGNDSSIHRIDLIGVKRGMERQGVGRALTAFFMQEFGRASRLEVGTQAANAPSIRLYEGLGFRWDHASYVLHMHVNNSR